MLTSEQASSVYSGSGILEVTLNSTMIRTTASFMAISWFLITDGDPLDVFHRLQSSGSVEWMVKQSAKERLLGG